MAGTLDSSTGSIRVTLLNTFAESPRLLVQELLGGVNRALGRFKILKRTHPFPCPLVDLLETLCETRMECLDARAGAQTVGPMLWWFPPFFKQNLLSFLYLLSSVTPRQSLLQTLRCISQDPCPDPWVTTMSCQLKRSLDTGCVDPLLSAAGCSRVEQLSKRVEGSTHSGPWTELLFTELELELESGFVPGPSHRKRSLSFARQEEEPEEGQRSKRKRVIRVDGPEGRTSQDSLRRLEQISAPDPHAPRAFSDFFPAHMKVQFLQVQEVLDTEMGWDQNSVEVLKVLNDCSPMQMEALCQMLNLSEVTDRTLLKLCDGLQSLDLSYSSAVTLIRSLMLQRVLTLSEPASRTLLTAMTSLCLRYTRPMCHAVIGPVLEDAHMGSHQAELLNQLVLHCLDTQYKMLLLQMTLKLTWTESSLSVLYSLLNSKLDMNAQVFGRLVDQLNAQGFLFSNSSTFAKIMLTMLTQYSCHVTVAHKHSLSSVLMQNQTFLKKSLKAAIKRI
ncbi:Fanconi anemia group E protein [Neosynchiropus ocellatus]